MWSHPQLTCCGFTAFIVLGFVLLARVPSVGFSVLPAAASTSCRSTSCCLQWRREYFRRSRPRAIICTSRARGRAISAEIYGVDPAITTVLPSPFDPQHVQHRAPDRALPRRSTGTVGVGDDGIALLFVANELHRKGVCSGTRGLGARLAMTDLTLHLIGTYASKRVRRDHRAPGLDASRSLPRRDRRRGLVVRRSGLVGTSHAVRAVRSRIVEALASGVPVITTRVAGAAEAVQHGVRAHPGRPVRRVRAHIADSSRSCFRISERRNEGGSGSHVGRCVHSRPRDGTRRLSRSCYLTSSSGVGNRAYLPPCSLKCARVTVFCSSVITSRQSRFLQEWKVGSHAFLQFRERSSADDSFPGNAGGRFVGCISTRTVLWRPLAAS